MPTQGQAPSPAVAPPPGQPRFPLFESLRAIAALSIVLFHVAAITGALELGYRGDVLAMLSRGVTVFFVISGFLLYRPFVDARAAGAPVPSVRRYFRRRVLRIVPAYWVALTALAIFPGLVGVFTHDWWRYYFFLQPYSSRTFAGGIPVAWSLCVEMSFYLALPLWALAIRRLLAGSTKGGWIISELVPIGLLAVGGALVQVAAARQDISVRLAETLPGQVTWLALGMGLAVASVAITRAGRPVEFKEWIAAHPGACWLGALASLAALAAVLHPGGIFGIAQALQTQQPAGRTLAGIALTGSLAVLLLAPAIFGDDAGGGPRRVLAAPTLAWLGLVSYAVYLYHLPIAELLGMSDPARGPGLGLATKIDTLTTPALLALTLAATIAVAAASYYFVELPFLRRKEPRGLREPLRSAAPRG